MQGTLKIMLTAPSPIHLLVTIYSLKSFFFCLFIPPKLELQTMTEVFINTSGRKQVLLDVAVKVQV